MAKRKQGGQDTRVDLPHLHAAQKEIVKHPARHKVVAAGRRFGKSYLGVGQAMIVAARGGHAWWCGPSYPLTQGAWDLMKHWARQMPRVEIREAERRIMFPPGSERDMPGQVQIKSADNPDSLVSVGLDFLVVDEAARVKEEAWTMSLRPTLADRQGGALFISTPKGRSRWFYRLWKEAHEKDNWAAFQFPTSANPLIPPEEIEEACQDMPALLFRQEFLAEFVEATGYMFLRTWFRNTIPEPFKGRYIRFWDLAASPEGDYSVGTKLGLIDGKYIVADVVRGRWDWPNLRRIITDTALEDGPEVRVGVEQAALELHAVQDLQSLPELASIVIKGIPVRPASASVRALYENLPRDKRAKAARAASWLARAEAGNVVLVEGLWNKAWLDEITDFPMSGVPDDQCLLPGTILPILRPDETRKAASRLPMLAMEAQDVREGDYLLTHKGYWQQVVKVFSRQYAGKVITLKPQGNRRITITLEHPVWCVKNKSKWNCAPPRAEGIPAWVSAKQVARGDSVIDAVDNHLENSVGYLDLASFLLPERYNRKGWSQLIISDEDIRFANPQSHPIKRFVPIGPGLCRLMGYYVAEGSLGTHCIGWSFASKEKDYISDTQSLLGELFGTQASLYSANNGTTLSVSSLVLLDFFSQFGRGAVNKAVPFWILHLPTELQIEFIKGAWRGDGCSTSRSMIYVSASYSLILGLRMILYRMGIVPTIAVGRKHGRTGTVINGKAVRWAGPLYMLRISGNYATQLANTLGFDDPRPDIREGRIADRIVDGLVHRRVRKAETSEYKGLVYNFQVAGDNSYQTESLVVHNCDSMSGAVQMIGRPRSISFGWV